ncbi:MAG: hypothetical protein H7268_14310 [Sandarakinorhabdus sp.]|nr:hypothetical protein [Sandarakinorhabdus sp.]
MRDQAMFRPIVSRLSNVGIGCRSYRLTRARSRPETAAMAAFQRWLTSQAAREARR